MNNVILKSGFQSGAELFRVEFGSDGLPTLKRVAVAHSNTYTDDGDDTQVITIDFPAVSAHYGWNAHCRNLWTRIEFVGIDEADLIRPCTPPAGGVYWYALHRDGDYTRSVQVKTLREYMEGLVECDGVPLDVFKDHNWTAMPYSCGDQAAAEFWRYRDGTVEVAGGVGDNTPYHAAGEIRWPLQDRLEEEAALNNEVKSALEVARAAYARHVNPLPLLRRACPGMTFVFVREDEDALVKMSGAGARVGVVFVEGDMGGGNRLCVFRA